MLDKWLSELRALLQDVQASSQDIANTVPGCDAPSVDATVTPPDAGCSELVPVPKIPSEVPMRDVLIARTERALSEAIQLHAQATRGDAGILTNYVVIAETVDANLDNEVDKRSLQLLTSPDCTAWALVGFSAALQQAVIYGSV